MQAYVPYLTLFLSICSLLYGTERATAQDRGANRISTEQNIDFAGNVHGLFVGISEYMEEDNKLDYANADAELIHDLFLDLFPGKNSTLYRLLDSEATEGNIYDRLQLIRDSVKAGDLVILYFAGHGFSAKPASREIGFYYCFDSPSLSNLDIDPRAAPTVRFSDLADDVTYLVKDREAQVWLILDACRAGNILTDFEVGLSINQDQFQHSINFLSCSGGEYSYEMNDIKHGVFTYLLHQGLAGMADETPEDLQISTYELHSYIMNNIGNYLNEYQQNPVIFPNNRRPLLAVNPETKQKMLENKQEMIALDVQSDAGRGDSDPDLNDGIDDKYKELLARFNKSIEQEDLIAGTDNSVDLYRIAQNIPDFPPNYLRRMKSILVDALMRDSQIYINAIISSSRNLPVAANLVNAANKLQYAVDILGSEDRLFDRLQARRYFLEAYAIIRSRKFYEYHNARDLLERSMLLEPYAAFTHHAIADLNLYEEKYDSARYHIDKALAIIPSWSTPKNLLGLTYYELGEYDQAIEIFRQRLAIDSTDGDALTNLSLIYQDLGRYDEAEQWILKAIRHYDVEDRNFPVAMINHAMINLKRGNIGKAESILEEIISLDPDYVWAKYWLGDLYMDRVGKPLDGINLLESAIQSEPDYSSGYRVLGNYYYKVGNYQAADSLFRIAIEKDPHDVWAYEGLGLSLLYQGREELAEDIYRKCLEINDHKADAHMVYGFFLTEVGRTAEAEVNFRRAIEIKPMYQTGNNALAWFYVDKKDTAQAQSIYSDLLQKFPSSPQVFQNYANFLFSIGKTELAEENYRIAIRIDSAFAEGYASLAYLNVINGHYLKGADYFVKASELNPYQYQPSTFIDFLIQQAYLERNVNNMKAFENGLNAATRVEANNNRIIYELGKHYYLTGNPAKAAEHLEKALRDEGLSIDLIEESKEYLARCLLESNRYDEALEIIEDLKATARFFNRLDVVLSYLKSGKKSSAEELINQVILEQPYLLEDDHLPKIYSAQSINDLNKLLTKVGK